jgi:hypothetical protein
MSYIGTETVAVAVGIVAAVAVVGIDSLAADIIGVLVVTAAAIVVGRSVYRSTGDAAGERR